MQLLSRIGKVLGGNYRLQKALGIGAALLLPLAGCVDESYYNKPTPNLRVEYALRPTPIVRYGGHEIVLTDEGEHALRPTPPSPVEPFSKITGKIVRVQPSHLSYNETWGTNPGGAQNPWGSRISATHEFIYVIVRGADEKLHTLVYPYSSAIPEGDATITFRPLEGGMIDADEFIDKFLNPEFFTNDNFGIRTKGFIVDGGITYHEKEMKR